MPGTAPLLDPARIETWCRRLIAGWRAARAEALPDVAAHADAAILHLGPPLQVTAVLAEHRETGSRGVGFLLERDPDRADGVVRVVALSTQTLGEGEEGALGIAARGVSQCVENQVRNWYPGRPPVEVDCGGRIGMARRQQDEHDTAVWIVAGDPSAADVDEFVKAAFTLPQSLSSTLTERPHAGEPQLWQVERRSDTAMWRWLESNAEELLRALGVVGPFWCGVNLPRAEVLGRDERGDFDFIGGPLRWTLSPEAQRDRLQAIARSLPPSVDHSWVQGMAARSVAEEGALEWPPALEMLVACEAVASYLDVDKAKLKRTLRDEMHRIQGQLELLERCAFERIGLLHVLATRPGEPTGANPWFQSMAEGSAALDALAAMGDAAIPRGPERAGVFRVVMAAVGDLCERTAGSGAELQVVRPATDALASNSMQMPWRVDALLPRLRALPTPRAYRAFIRSCNRCKEWYWSPWTPLGECPCRDARDSNSGE